MMMGRRDIGPPWTGVPRSTGEPAITYANISKWTTGEISAGCGCATGGRSGREPCSGRARSTTSPTHGITSLHLPLDGIADREFWDEWASDWRFGTPVYYGPHLARFPERSVAVLEAIAAAEPGGVLFHCMGGRAPHSDAVSTVSLIRARMLERTAAGREAGPPAARFRRRVLPYCRETTVGQDGAKQTSPAGSPRCLTQPQFRP
jgi:hypothetical protein